MTVVELVTTHDVYQDIVWEVVVDWLMPTTLKFVQYTSPQALSLIKTKVLDNKASYVVGITWCY